MFFWVVTSRSNVVGYQHFRWPRCLYLHGEVNSDMKGTLIWGGSIRGVRVCGGQHCWKNTATFLTFVSSQDSLGPTSSYFSKAYYK